MKIRQSMLPMTYKVAQSFIQKSANYQGARFFYTRNEKPKIKINDFVRQISEQCDIPIGKLNEIKKDERFLKIFEKYVSVLYQTGLNKELDHVVGELSKLKQEHFDPEKLSNDQKEFSQFCREKYDEIASELSDLVSVYNAAQFLHPGLRKDLETELKKFQKAELEDFKSRLQELMMLEDKKNSIDSTSKKTLEIFSKEGRVDEDLLIKKAQDDIEIHEINKKSKEIFDLYINKFVDRNGIEQLYRAMTKNNVTVQDVIKIIESSSDPDIQLKRLEARLGSPKLAKLLMSVFTNLKVQLGIGVFVTFVARKCYEYVWNVGKDIVNKEDEVAQKKMVERKNDLKTSGDKEKESVDKVLSAYEKTAPARLKEVSEEREKYLKSCRNELDGLFKKREEICNSIELENGKVVSIDQVKAKDSDKVTAQLKARSKLIDSQINKITNNLTIETIKMKKQKNIAISKDNSATEILKFRHMKLSPDEAEKLKELEKTYANISKLSTKDQSLKDLTEIVKKCSELESAISDFKAAFTLK